jgi:deoxyribose-phosphate aldolase
MNTVPMMHEKTTTLAAMIDHSVLHPTATDDDLAEACRVAVHYRTATVCVKPYAVQAAAVLVAGSSVKVCSVIGFPHGNSTTEIKVAECVRACRDGAAEIDMVVNIGKVCGGQWDYVREEIRQINEACVQHGAILKVIFENDYLNDEQKIRLCVICSELHAAFVKTSTGYGHVKGADGTFSTRGATIPDLILMRKHSAPDVQVKAAGGIRTLDEMLAAMETGIARVGATATAAILEEANRRFGGGGETSMDVKADANGY